MTAPRGWGFWTRGKLDILRDYLDSLTTASKNKATDFIYLDLFAGQSQNTDRDTGVPIEGSARIALSTENPPFTTLRFFDLSHAHDLEKELAPMIGGRDVQFVQGDCNTEIVRFLEGLRNKAWAPAFAFIDPDGPDCWWTTLEHLARFKEGRKYKVELWMLFHVDMFTRFLRVDGGKVRPVDAERISRMFGTDQWLSIYEAHLDGRIDPRAARAEYVNLIRWRIVNVLGYKWAHTFDVRNTKRPIYSMIFATDHPAGNDIMSHLYRAASQRFPKMQQDARDRKTGAVPLFELPHQSNYEYEPPTQPYH